MYSFFGPCKRRVSPQVDINVVKMHNKNINVIKRRIAPAGAMLPLPPVAAHAATDRFEDATGGKERSRRDEAR